MNIPCDGCKIKGVCGLIGSRKYAVNAVDRIKEKVDDEYIQITVECTARQAEKDQAVAAGEGAGRDMPGVLPLSQDGDRLRDADGGEVHELPTGASGDAGEGGTGEDTGIDEEFVKAAWEYCKEEDDERLSRLLQKATEAADEVFGEAET